MTLRDEIAMAICLAGCGIAAHRSDYYGEADAALATFRTWLADEGLVVVPGEATEEQIKEAMLFRSLNERPPHVHNTAGLYRAMLSAAPDPLEPDEHG